MTSLSSLLRQPTLVNPPRRLGAGIGEWVDPETQAVIDQATEDGYRRGLVAGRMNAESDLATERDNASKAIATAVDHAIASINQSFTSGSRQMIVMAFELAELIAGHSLEHDGSVIAERVAAALDQIDDEQLVLNVAPADEEMFRKVYAMNPKVTVVASPQFSPGEAMLRGLWAEADLTRAGIRSVLEEALDA